MLESPKGRAALLDTATQVLTVSERTKKEWAVKKKDETVNATWINGFLQGLREDYPNVILSNRVDGLAVTRRRPWLEKTGVWRPKEAVLLLLDLNMMAYAAEAVQTAATTPNANNTAAFEKHLIMASISIAHEMVHFMVGKIIGTSTSNTPEKVNSPPNLSKEDGEAGRFWEEKFIGRLVNAYQTTGDNNLKQGGTLWADYKRSVGAAAVMGQVSQVWVKGMLARQFATNLPIVVTDSKRAESVRTVRDLRGAPASNSYINTDAEFTTAFARLAQITTRSLSGRDWVRITALNTNPANIVVPPK
ncbi:hypothetical protein QBC35DRAFT_421248 [Podospora australis]|uniref:Uncharacterized protein n=1 Tax=Podospora australis TaxID=1536484 RepID=A0AAN6WL33_9PEZI|nr:hypothetical protein QBC35DRAFT_421248 [Podospora australis]